MFLLEALLHALQLSAFMFWEVLWPLGLGFLLSALVQTLVSKRTVAGTLGTFSPRSVLLACGFGAASSSCSYAAVAVGRALFRRGSDFKNAIIFEFASTNLVFELGLLLLVLLGWQFVAAEFAGGLLMVAILAVIFKYTLRKRLVEKAREQAARGLQGKMEGHGEMDMSITEGPLRRRLFSGRALTAISHYFWMDVASLWQDLGLGFLIAGALAAWVPGSFWRAFFLSGHPVLAQFWGPLIGPVVSMLSFVCSVGNVPLAAVLWNGGISFGGVISFIFADRIILPILDIYRRYYGGRMSLYLLVASYLAMALAGFLIGLLFGALGITPAHRQVQILTAHPEWSYTTFLDLAALGLVALLGYRFLTTGGPQMLRAMEVSPDDDTRLAVDPVCGMTVDSAGPSETSEHNGVTYHFCSAGCRSEFERQPDRYLRAAAGQPGAQGEHR